jgi:hypothetical protein
MAESFSPDRLGLPAAFGGKSAGLGGEGSGGQEQENPKTFH